MRDTFSNVKVVKAVQPTDPSATGTITGAIIDRQNFGSVLFAIQNGAIAASGFTCTPVIKSGAATNALASCADSVLIGTEAGAQIAGSTSDGKVAKIGYIGGDRYVQCNLVIAGAATGFHSAVAILGNPRKAPQDSQVV